MPGSEERKRLTEALEEAEKVASTTEGSVSSAARFLARSHEWLASTEKRISGMEKMLAVEREQLKSAKRERDQSRGWLEKMVLWNHAAKESLARAQAALDGAGIPRPPVDRCFICCDGAAASLPRCASCLKSLICQSPECASSFEENRGSLTRCPFCRHSSPRWFHDRLPDL